MEFFTRIFIVNDLPVRLTAASDGRIILSLDISMAGPDEAALKTEDEHYRKMPEVIRSLWEQAKEYFCGGREYFTIPFCYSRSLKPTSFQQSVWEALEGIPYGTTLTYGELARRLGRPGASRAVGHALHRNPHSLLRPCHRVVSATGPGGFAGGEVLKRLLLAIEQNPESGSEGIRKSKKQG